MDLLDKVIPKIGDRIARYEIIRELGRGGFGVVYKARQAGLEADVAIKLLIPQLSDQAGQMQLLERFEQEARVIKQLEHPAALKVRDFGRWNGLPYLVTEFVRGTTLEDVIANEAPLPPERIARVVRQVLGCLAEAHYHQIIHRDLKPANLMLRDIFGEQDAVKVLDFGIAKVGSAGGVQTMTGMRFGTPWYMAPEQCRGLPNLDGRLDLYAMGLIMAECITGQRVVQATDMMGAFYVQANRDPLAFEPPVQQSPLFPVIYAATQKEREYRYPDALTMRKALDSLMGGGAYERPATATPAPEFQPPPTLITPMPSAPSAPAWPSTPAPPVYSEPSSASSPSWPAQGMPSPSGPGPVAGPVPMTTPPPMVGGSESGGAPGRAEVESPVGRATGLWLGVLVALLAALGAGAWLLLRSDESAGGEVGPATVHARIEANMPGFEVLVDGRVVATADGTRIELDLPPDHPRVDLRRADWALDSLEVERGSHGARSFHAVFAPEVQRSRNGAMVYVPALEAGGATAFYLEDDPIRPLTFNQCCREPCSQSLVASGLLRTERQTQQLGPNLQCTAGLAGSCRPTADGSCDPVFLNCLSQQGAARVCEAYGGRLPTLDEMERAGRRVLSSPVWQWTSTLATEGSDRFVVYGGPAGAPPPYPAEISSDGRTAVVRGDATPPFMGVRCVTEVAAVLEVLAAGNAGPAHEDSAPETADLCARGFARLNECAASCPTHGGAACDSLPEGFEFTLPAGACDEAMAAWARAMLSAPNCEEVLSTFVFELDARP